MHVLGDMQFSQLAEFLSRSFLVHQEFRNDADGFAAIGHNRIGDRAHEAVGAAAIDEIDAVLGHRPAEDFRSLTISRFMAGLRSAVNADGGNSRWTCVHGGTEHAAHLTVKTPEGKQIAFSCTMYSKDIGFCPAEALFAVSTEQTMNKNNAGFWAFLGVVTAIAIGAFFLTPNIFKTNPESASVPAPKSNMVDATVEAPETPSAGEGLPADTADTESDAGGSIADPKVAADTWVTPSFDLLRVEPDGSTVIAGRAEPGTMLDIMNGETVIASSEIGASGDFAVILDTPLPAGDYQLTLRITGKDGAMRQSEEVATVSVPENADGELLAMVSKPGKASRIIAQPIAGATGETAEADVETPASGETELAAAPNEETPAAGAGAVTGSEVAAPDQPAAQNDAGTDVAANSAASVEDASTVVETPALPEASALLTTSAPQVASERGAVETSASTTSSESEVAMASPEAAEEAAPAALSVDANVRVDAVEIEGDRIFVAGSATPGSKVQVAADGVVIGTETADETGRFIIEATSQLSVGDHIISADLLDATGENVLLRATVPFNRPEGEALAAVAPAEPAVDSTAPASTASPEANDVPKSLILPDIASLSEMREEAFEALSSVQAMISGTDTPDTAAVSLALEAAVEKLQSAAMADLSEGSSDEAMAIARSMRIQAEAALAVIMPEATGAPSNVDDQAGAQPSDDLMNGDMSKLNGILTQAETALSEPADMAVAATDAADELAANPGQPGEPKTILQAPLASTPGAVIIRRGDTLWQISRRTYGEGVRYTTIYVANRSQIQNPDRIKPGQVFAVPEKPLENAEEMHQQLLGNGKNP